MNRTQKLRAISSAVGGCAASSCGTSTRAQSSIEMYLFRQSVPARMRLSMECRRWAALRMEVDPKRPRAYFDTAVARSIRSTASRISALRAMPRLFASARQRSKSLCGIAIDQFGFPMWSYITVSPILRNRTWRLYNSSHSLYIRPAFFAREDAYGLGGA